MLKRKNVEDQWLGFSQLLLEVCVKFIPRRKWRTINRPQWFSAVVKNAVNKNAKRWKKYKKSKDMKHLDDLKKQSKFGKSLIRNTKSTFEKRLADQN